MRLDFPGIPGSGEIWMDVVKAICGDTDGKSLLDLMCYRAPHTPQLGFKTPVYVDVQDRDFDYPREKKSFVKWDVRKIMDCRLVVNNAPFDVAICSDGVEHLSKEEGRVLKNNIDFLARKSVFFTPLGPISIGEEIGPDAHQSGWYPDDFWGYALIVFPDFHPTLNCGAFFAFRCPELENEFNRIKKELKTKSWIKNH